MVVRRWGSHTGDAYSKTVRTTVVYVVALTSMEQSLKFPRRKPRERMALVAVSAMSMCCDQDKSLATVTPRYLLLSNTSSNCPCNVQDD